MSVQRIVDDLRAHGSAEVKLADGRVVRLLLDHDESVYPDEYINHETDTWGRVARADFHGRPHRPEGFDGSAVKVLVDRDGEWWWMPPLAMMGLSVAEWSSPENRERRDAERAAVRRILDEGLLVLSARVVSRCQCCDSERVDGGASLGGIEPVEWGEWDSYLGSLVADLFGELELSADVII